MSSDMSEVTSDCSGDSLSRLTVNSHENDCLEQSLLDCSALTSSKEDTVTPDEEWQSRFSGPIGRMNTLLKLGVHSDITVVFPVTGKMYKVHKLVLAMSSPVLEKLVYGDQTNTQPSVLYFDEESPEAFKWLLANMYMGCRNFAGVEIASSVYTLAFKYRMNAVCLFCKQYLMDWVSSSDVQFAYQAAMVSGDEHLAVKCSQIASGVWSQSRGVCIRELNQSALTHLLSQDRLCISRECLLFEAIVDWGRHRLKDSWTGTGEQLREKVDEFLPLIRFLAMTPEEFLDKVSSSHILTPDECVTILMNIRGLSTSLPRSFTCSILGPRITVFDDSLMQALISCPHHHKKSSDSHSKYYGHGIGFKLYFSESIFVKRIEISSSLLPKDSQLIIVDTERKNLNETVDGQFLGHGCICGKGFNHHSNLVSWKFDPPLPLKGKKEYIGRVKHSKTDSQVETIKESLEGVTICGQITSSPLKLDFFKH